MTKASQWLTVGLASSHTVARSDPGAARPMAGHEEVYQMRKLLLAAVICLSLGAVALPGTVLAANGGNSEAAHDCRANSDGLGFKNRGACVSFFAQGGTLGTFESTCIGHGGTFAASGQEPDGETFAPICTFSGTITITAFAAAQTALDPFCPPTGLPLSFSPRSP